MKPLRTGTADRQLNFTPEWRAAPRSKASRTLIDLDLNWAEDLESVDWEELSALYRAVLGNKSLPS